MQTDKKQNTAATPAQDAAETAQRNAAKAATERERYNAKQDDINARRRQLYQRRREQDAAAAAQRNAAKAAAERVRYNAKSALIAEQRKERRQNAKATADAARQAAEQDAEFWSNCTDFDEAVIYPGAVIHNGKILNENGAASKALATLAKLEQLKNSTAKPTKKQLRKMRRLENQAEQMLADGLAEGAKTPSRKARKIAERQHAAEQNREERRHYNAAREYMATLTSADIDAITNHH